jgi:hypothetical protein
VLLLSQFLFVQGPFLLRLTLPQPFLAFLVDIWPLNTSARAFDCSRPAFKASFSFSYLLALDVFLKYPLLV